MYVTEDGTDVAEADEECEKFLGKFFSVGKPVRRELPDKVAIYENGRF